MEQKTLLTGPTRVSGVSMPETLLEVTRARAQQEDRSFSSLIRRALVAYLAGNEQENAGSQLGGE